DEGLPVIVINVGESMEEIRGKSVERAEEPAVDRLGRQPFGRAPQPQVVVGADRAHNQPVQRPSPVQVVVHHAGCAPWPRSASGGAVAARFSSWRTSASTARDAGSK